MLQNIVFQDNIYQLSRSIDVLYEGLLLDLSKDFFLDKIVDDILFFDSVIQKLYRQLTVNDQISDYEAIIHNLYTCENKYIQLLNILITGNTSMKEVFEVLITKLTSIHNQHLSLRNEITQNIQKLDKNTDSRDIVSQNELSELLNF